MVIYKASLTADDLVSRAEGLLDTVYLPEREDMFRIVNMTMTSLFRRVIKAKRVAALSSSDGYIDLSLIDKAEDEGEVFSCDVFRVYHGGKELKKGNADRAYVFSSEGMWHICGPDTIKVTGVDDGQFEITYCVRPKEYEDGDGRYLDLPDEFLPLLESRLLLEAYKRAGEDELAAKWTLDYNAYLADFERYLGGKRL